jgi:hypothetical protein
MHIVSASMHDGKIAARAARHPLVTRIGQPGLLFDRQGIHVCANEDRRTCAVAQNAHDSIRLLAWDGVLADVFRDFKTHRPQFAREVSGSVRLEA